LPLDNIREIETPDEIMQMSGIPYPNPQPYTHITMACVVWQDRERMQKLLEYVRPYFAKLAIGVQRSTDGTLEMVQSIADVVVVDEHRGFGDATFGPNVLPKVKSEWTLKIDADEWPSEDLLNSLSHATWAAEHHGVDAIWIPFISSVDGRTWDQEHAHLRLFRTRFGWPGTLHSRPPIWEAILWRRGTFTHSRTLDEMVQDYLRYYEVGINSRQWREHNVMMMRANCEGIAETKGWPYIKGFAWWPQVLKIAFSGVDPDPATR
jgi:hypothetical protein